MSGKHAFLPPSGADAWVHCAQWPTMNSLFPSVDTDVTDEGRAAHWALAEVRRGNAVAEGQVTEDGAILDADMVRHATETARKLPAEDREYIETQIPIHRINPECFGTPDLFSVSSDGRRLKITDYKYGHGFVDAVENWQLITYASGVLDFLGIDGFKEHHLEIEFTIAQPRNYHREGPVRRWVVEAVDLRPYWNRLSAAADRAMSDDREATPGEHCLNCPGRLACTALQQSGYRVLQVAGEATPFKLPVQAAAQELAQLETARVMLKARIEGLRAEVQAAYEKGERNLGYVIEQAPGRLNWTAPAEEIIELGNLYGLNLAKPLEAKTPLQCIDAGLDAGVVNRLAVRGRGAPELVKTESSFAYRAFFQGK